MPFRSRLHLLQWLAFIGMADVALGLLLLVVAARFLPGPVILWLLGSGFVLAIASSFMLSRLPCPRCGNAFCGAKYDENRRSSIFTSRCLSCGHRPAAPGAAPATGPIATPPAMTPPSQPLPQEVLAALQRGNAIEAIKLLRQWRKLDLRQAKAAIDQHLKGQPAAQPHGGMAGSTLPGPAHGALERGDRIGAIHLVRQQTGVDLKQAREMVDAAGTARAWKPGDLAPGEVGHTGEGVWLAILGVALAALVYVVFIGWPG